MEPLIRNGTLSPFGFLIAGILSEIISNPFIKKHLGSKALTLS